MSYVTEVPAVDDRAQAELRYAPQRAPARDPKRSSRVVRDARTASPVEHDAPLHGLGRSSQMLNQAAAGDRWQDIGPSR